MKWCDFFLFLFWNPLFTCMVRLLEVCLRFQVAQIKQVDCKLVPKMWIIIKNRHILIFLDNYIYKSKRRRYNTEVSAKWTEVRGKSGKINWLILKTKADLKEKPWKRFNSWYATTYKMSPTIWYMKNASKVQKLFFKIVRKMERPFLILLL